MVFKFQENIKNIHIIVTFLITTFLIISPKWFFSFFIFDEIFDLRIINEISDNAYIPLIKSFSEFDFSPNYSAEINNNKFVGFPFISLLINSLIFKLFDIYSFLILEFTCVFFFLFIFYKIFITFKFQKKTSVIFSIFIFLTPLIFIDLSYFNVSFLNNIALNYKTFYSLRFPRPIISNLFLFSFVLLIIRFYLQEEANLKLILLSIILMAFSLHVFFYHFIFESFLLFFIYLIKFRFKIFDFIKQNFKYHIYFISIILLSILVLLYQNFLSEPDYLQRIGLVEINYEQKKILIKYLINFFTRFEFLLLLFICSFIFLLNNNKALNTFYLLFISTIISAIFFIVVYNKGIDYYHFFNWILTSGLLYLILSLIFIFNKYFLSNIDKNKLIVLQIFFGLLFIIYFNFSVILKKNNSFNNNLENRNELKHLVSFFTENKSLLSKNHEILTLNYNFSLWLILNDYKNFSFVPVSFWTSKKTSQIENDLISAFRALKLNEDDFIEFLSNKKKGTRFKNPEVERFYDRIYLANQLRTFDKKEFYTKEEVIYINKNSPLISHQLIIPKNEFLRLKEKFLNINQKADPKIIVLDSYNQVLNKNNVKIDEYCLIYESKDYLVLFSKKLLTNCKISKN